MIRRGGDAVAWWRGEGEARDPRPGAMLPTMFAHSANLEAPEHRSTLAAQPLIGRYHEPKI